MNPLLTAAPDRRLRLGWRLLLYLAGFLAVLFAGAVLDHAGPWWLVRPVSALLQVAGLYGVTRLLRAKVDRRAWGGMGLRWDRREAAWLGGGFALGCAMMAIAFGIQWALGWVRVEGTELSLRGAAPALGMLAVGLLSFLRVGFGEELLMRGYYFQNLGEALPIWAATLVSGVIFGLLHLTLAGFNLAFVFSATLITALLVLFRLSTGSLSLAIGWHAGWDWLQSALLGLDQVAPAERERALLVLSQRGPAWLVGQAPAVESGAVYIGLQLVAALGLYAWLRRSGRSVPWPARLGPEGSPVDAVVDAPRPAITPQV